MSEAAPGWRQNVAAATLAAFIGFTGFTLVMPFLPIYIGELGATDLRSASLWAGLSLGITPAVTAAVSPAWGRVADRYGRRAMVVRSLSSFVVVMSLMALVTRPWHVFALRAVQGLFAGYGGLTIAMAAESAPRERMPMAIGFVQMAQRLGPALGPVIGGLLAALVGLRHVFYVTAGFYAAACLLVVALYRERREAGARPARSPGVGGVRQFWSLPNFALMLGAIFTLQAVDRSLGPILPLFVSEGGASGSRVALLSGLLFSIWACAAAAGHYLGSRLLERFSERAVIVAAGGLSALAIGMTGLTRGFWWPALALSLFGAGIGAAMTAAYSVAGAVVPEGGHGTGFSLMTGASLAGLAVSPMASGAIAGHSLGAVFALDAAVLGAATILIGRSMRGAPHPASSGRGGGAFVPPAED